MDGMCIDFISLYMRIWTASVVEWSEFLTTDPGVPGSIPGHYKQIIKKSNGSGMGSTQPREYN
jgi:hypothetical protein